MTPVFKSKGESQYKKLSHRLNDEKFCGTKLLCLLTFNSSKTRSQVGIKNEGECESRNPEQVSTKVRVQRKHGGADLEEKKLSSSFFGGWLKVILAVLEIQYCLFDEKQLIVPETRGGYFFDN